MLLALSLQSLTLLGFAAASFQPSGIPFKLPVTTASGLAAEVVFSNLTNPRGIAFDAKENLLVIERGVGVTGFQPVAGGWTRTVVVNNTGLTHGIEVDGRNLYVSSAGQVLLYTYDPETMSITADTAPVVIVDGLPPDGDITTHTILLEKNALGKSTAILAGSGPFTNIDPTARDPSSGRSQIRRFSLPPGSTPPQWLSGELIGFGIRNPAGFAFAPNPYIATTPALRLYVVENGASIDNVTGLTATFVNDNPADELDVVNLETGLGKSYGFPDCTTLWNPEADPVGDPQYTSLSKGDQISLHLDPTRDDAWCREVSNNVPPILSFQAHAVPLDIKFLTPFKPGAGSLPLSFLGDAFVSFHGSFDRIPATGYGIARVPFPVQSSPIKDGYSIVVQASNVEACSPTSGCIRPVGLAFSTKGVLFASSDSSGELFLVKKT